MTRIGSDETLTSADVPAGTDEAKAERGLNASFDNDNRGYRYSNADIVRIFNTHWDEANRYRLRWIPEWQKAYLQYHGDMEDRGKAEWQANVSIPLPHAAVSTSAAKIVDSIFSNDDFFDILPFVRSDDAKVALAKNIIKWQLWKANGRSRIETSVKDALICGFGPMKVYFWEDTEERTVVDDNVVPYSPDEAIRIFGAEAYYTGQAPRARMEKGFADRNVAVRGLRLDPCLPTQVWLDPSGRGEYIIHLTRRRLSDVWSMAREQKDGSGNVIRPAVYDSEEVRRIRATQGEGQQEAEASIIRRDTPHLAQQPAVDVYEFWGDLRDPQNGAVLFSNVVITIANKMVCIRRPMRNPYYHRMLPFVIFSCADEPHQVYPYGILKQGMLLHDMINRATNITLDKQMLTVPQVQCAAGQLRNPADAGGANLSLKPGKVWQIKDPEKPAFIPVTGFTPPDQTDFVMIDRLKQDYNASVGMTEFSSAQVAQTQGRKTEGEVQAKTQAAQQVFNAAATHIEKNAISPLLKMIYYLSLQYESDYANETLLRMVHEDQDAVQLLSQMQTMTPEEIWDQLYLDAEFRCTGISLAISRQDKMNRLTTFLKMVSANPYIGVLTDQRQVIREFLQILDLNKSLMVPNAEQLIGTIQNAQIQQIVNPQQQPPQPQGVPGQNAHNTMEKAQGEATGNGQPPSGIQ